MWDDCWLLLVASVLWCLTFPFASGFWVLVAQLVKNLPAMWETGFDPWVGKISWRRKWQSTPVLLLGKAHGWRSLVGYSPWDHKESDTTERLHFFESCESLFPKQRFMVSLLCTRYCSGGWGCNSEQNKLNSWPHGVVSPWLFFWKLTLIYFCIKVFFWASLT